MLKRIVATVEIVALAGFLVMVALLLLKQPTKNLTALPPPSPAAVAGVTTVVDGQALFRSNCAGCHGGDGGGGIGPQLNGGAVTKSFSNAADELDFVKTGGRGMPAFQNQLNEAELQAVIDFTRTTLQSK
jgi:mono/diheme cytochrome c family protein